MAKKHINKEYLFNKTLAQDEPTSIGIKLLNELDDYIKTQLGGLKILCFGTYRMANAPCFAVDMVGLNNKNCSLNIGLNRVTVWDSMYHTVGIEVADSIDIMGIVQYLICTYQLFNVTENHNGALVYSLGSA